MPPLRSSSSYGTHQRRHCTSGGTAPLQQLRKPYRASSLLQRLQPPQLQPPQLLPPHFHCSAFPTLPAAAAVGLDAPILSGVFRRPTTADRFSRQTQADRLSRPTPADRFSRPIQPTDSSRPTPANQFDSTEMLRVPLRTLSENIRNRSAIATLFLTFSSRSKQG